ncbi:MAG: 30S ribosomal protein S20 [Ignavibacteriae bacterium]|nr:30S ribosomal protein S20 [Ignavibacteriota bacterium]
MPQHKSAEKRVRTASRKRARNRQYKTRMKNMIKELRDTKQKEQAAELYKKVSSMLDRIATKGIIHTNTAAHKKSKLAKFVQGLS